MAKHFKSKKIIRRISIFKYLFIVLMTYILIRLCIYSLVFISPNKYISTELLFIDGYNLVKDMTFNKPVNLLNYESTNEQLVILPVVSTPKDLKKVYIYSTHQSEKYADNKSIVKASKYLQQKLADENIETVVEEGSIQEFLIANNYSYNYSYVASKYFVEEEMNRNNYDLIIDLHRDAVSKSSSTTTINGTKYAKIMFVIGKKNKNYKKNYAVAEELNKLIEEKYPTLTRGILLQSGNNVNGIYNQDLASNIILIELGGNHNSYNEVQNTIDLVAPIIGEYLNGKEI